MDSPEERTSFSVFCRTCRMYFQAFQYFICMPCQKQVELLNPQEVLRSKLGDDLEVEHFKTEPLVKAGDNYGSTIVKATVTIKKKSEIETLHLIAKMLPPSRLMRKLYECDFTVAKEIFFYEEAIPAYDKLYGAKLDIVPKFYGGRLAVEPGEICVDEGAVVLLENLKESGYVMVDRFKGFNIDHMNLVIPAIAKFHAIGLAIKHKNPEFYTKIKKYAKPLEMPEEVMGIVVPEILRIVRKISSTAKYYDRVKGLTKTDGKLNCLMQIELESEDPWTCLVHRDLWINNFMFRIDDGKVKDFKFFDFQNYCLSSPMTDLIYFLWTSMERNFEHFDEVVELYRSTAHKILMQLECDASIFEKESFDERLKRDAQSEIFHSIMIAKAVEMRTMWEVVKVNEHLERRIFRMLEIYEEKGWFENEKLSII